MNFLWKRSAILIRELKYSNKAFLALFRKELIAADVEHRKVKYKERR